MEEGKSKTERERRTEGEKRNNDKQCKNQSFLRFCFVFGDDKCDGGSEFLHTYTILYIRIREEETGVGVLRTLHIYRTTDALPPIARKGRKNCVRACREALSPRSRNGAFKNMMLIIPHTRAASDKRQHAPCCWQINERARALFSRKLRTVNIYWERGAVTSFI